MMEDLETHVTDWTIRPSSPTSLFHLDSLISPIYLRRFSDLFYLWGFPLTLSKDECNLLGLSSAFLLTSN